ncbi:MAG: hypothetical protein ACO3BU_00700, partial [Ilumatobacteraceae bacterium]
EVPASSMGIVRVVRASLTAMIVVRVVMTVIARAAPANLKVTARVVRGSLTAMIDVRVVMMATARAAPASLTVMTGVVRASLIAMTGVRVAMMATAHAVRASLTVMTGARVVMMATAHAARASLTVTGRATIAARAGSTAMTGARVALIAAIATSRSVRRPTLIVVAQRSSSAKVVASTAKTTQLYRVARTTSGRSLTRGQCADRESGMFAATSGVQPTSALAINVLQIEETEMIGETGDISFLRLAPLTKSLRKKYVAPSVTDASLMSAARWVQPSMRMTVNDGVMRRSC